MTRKTRLCLAVSLALAAGAAQAQDWRSRTDAALETRMQSGGDVDVMILVAGRATAPSRASMPDPVARRTEFVRRLQQSATSSQRDLRAWLRGHGIEHRSYWIGNSIAATVPAELVPELAARADVVAVESNAPALQRSPVPEFASGHAPDAPTAVAWGVTKVRAPEVWALGIRGAGIVVAGQDTGYQWDHPALRAKYRGWNGSSADHNYNWHDAITQLIAGGSNSCGINLTVPCDDNGHGTHTMGTMVGDDGAAQQIGVAPDAKWISCRNMEEGDGRPETYTDCFQWFVAPTDLAGANPQPALAPHIINNSWGCPASELCDANAIAAMRIVVENVKAAGILVVVSAGNSGSGCNTIDTPAAMYEASFTVGWTNSSDGISGSSSRGPVRIDGVDRLKPNVAAPGSSICSSVPGGGYSCGYSGTSMAGPHVAGVAALLMQANPALIGDPDAVEDILEASTVQLTSTQTCGSAPAFPGSVVPNATFGWGRIDAFAAYQLAIANLEPPMMRDGFEEP
jgi:subtilisin family serine protease